MLDPNLHTSDSRNILEKGLRIAAVAGSAAVAALGGLGLANRANAASVSEGGPEVNNVDTLHCQQIETGAYGQRTEGFIHKERDEYKLGSRAVKVTLSLNDYAIYVGRKMEVDCDDLTKNVATAQVMVAKTGKNGKRRYVPYGEPSRGLQSVTPDHSGSAFNVKHEDKSVRLKLPKALTSSDVASRKYAIRTTIVSTPKKVVPKEQLRACVVTPMNCELYPDNLKPLTRTRITPISQSFANNVVKFKEARK